VNLPQTRIPSGKLRFATVIATLVLGTFLTTQASAQDTDADGLPNSVETNTGTYVSPSNTGTNPNNPDTDGDGAGDWYEVFASLTNPTNASSKPNVPYPLPKPDNSTGVTNKPVKVFILAGQSNMVGMGDVNPITANGTLSKIVKTEKKFPNLLDAGGINWSVRQDVQYRGVISAIAKAGLTVGQGSSSTAIGPELGMGHVLGYSLDEPVLIIKAAQGNRSLIWDFLPPGSPRSTAGTTTYAGYGDSQPSWTGTPPGPPTGSNWYAGWQYDQSFLAFSDWYPPGGIADVVNVADVLDNWATEYPQWAAQGFEIAGFAWFQGWNDGLSYTNQAADRYEANLVQLIKQLRLYYEGRYPTKIAPNAPFVVATCGFNGFAATGNRLKVANAQLAVGNPTKYPEFAGNVKTMEARGYWRTREQSNSKQDYHYWRNAETFMLVGDALGRGMIDLLAAATPPPILPNVWSQTAGGAQSWTTGSNWQDGAVPDPTSATTMNFSNVDIAADTTLTLGANRTAQIWKFGDTSGTQNWIVSAGNTMTLAGTTPTIEVANNTTRLDTVVAGTAGLTKTGTGNLTLTANNTFTGTTTITAGTLQLGNNGTTGSLAASGTIANNAALIFSRSNDLVQGTDFPAVITGNGTLTKLGAGVLTLSGNNSYTGNIAVSGGTLRLTSSAALGSSALVTIGGNRLEIVTDTALSASPALSSQGGTFVSDRATPGAGLTQVFGNASIGNGLTTFAAGGNVTSGAAVIQLGNVTNNNGSTATPGLNPTTANLVITGNVTLGTINAGTANFTLGGNSSVNSIGGAIVNGTRAIGNVIKSNTSTWTLSGNNTYDGTTTVSAGTLITTKAGALPGFNAAAKVIFNGGTLVAQVGGSGWTEGEMLGLIGNATKTSGVLGIDTTNANLTQGATAYSLGNLGLTKLGANTLTLTRANTYSGATVISGGTLALGGNNTLPNTALTLGNATLNAATFSDTLGTLAITGNATINLGTGATLSFSNSSAVSWPGTLTLTGTFVPGSSISFGVGGLTADQLSRISAVGFSGFSLNGSGFLTAGTVPSSSITNTTADANGTCTPTGVTLVNIGGNQTYTLTPNPGYTVATLTVNGTSVTPVLSYTFSNVTANQTIQATFVNTTTATLYWDSDNTNPGFGNTSGTWGTTQFWTTDAGGASMPVPITTTTTNSVNFGTATLNYNNAAVSVAAGGVNSGNLTFGAGQSTPLTLSGGPITLGDTAVITVNNAANTIASVLAGAATSLTKAGAGNLTLSANNTYSGNTVIGAGSLRLGASNVLPDGPGKGDVTVTGTLDLNTFSEAINGLSGNGTVDTVAGGTPTLTLGGGNATSTFDGIVTDTTGTLSLEKTGNGTVILTGANGYSGPTTITGGTLQIGNNGTTGAISSTAGVTNDAVLIFNRSDNLTFTANISGGGALTKQGAGMLTLSGNNSYTGQTSISAGTLKLDSPSALQASSLVSLSSATTLQIASSAGITSSGDLSMNGSTIALNQPDPAPGLTHAFEQFTFTHQTQNFTSSNVTDGNATLTFTNGTVRSGSGGTATLNPTGVNLVIGSFAGGNTGTSTLRLGGTTTLNRIDDAIENGARTTQNIIKSNTGTWTLSGDNVYTGNTTIEQGTLKVGASGALPSGAGTGNVVFNTAANTAILDLNGNDATINGLIQASASTTNRVVNNSPATLATLTAGENDTTSTFAGIIADNTGTGGTLALTKTGTGTLTLSGTNTYTGDTTVSAGTLVLTDNAQLRFVTGATSGTNNRLTGAGTVTLNGDFNIDTTLTDASALSSGSWTLVDTAMLTETFGSTFTLVGAGWSETANIWIKTVGSKNYTFTESSGILALSSNTSYASWAATNASTTTPAQDQDNDGVSNAVEYVLGGTALTNDLSKLPAASISGENILFTFKRAQASINANTTLTIETGTLLHTWPGSYTIGADTATPPTGVTILKGVPAGFDTVTLSVPRSPDLQKFFRIKVIITP
jgi:autotransporter-associated beta strand protein